MQFGHGEQVCDPLAQFVRICKILPSINGYLFAIAVVDVPIKRLRSLSFSLCVILMLVVYARALVCKGKLRLEVAVSVLQCLLGAR